MDGNDEPDSPKQQQDFDTREREARLRKIEAEYRKLETEAYCHKTKTKAECATLEADRGRFSEAFLQIIKYSIAGIIGAGLLTVWATQYFEPLMAKNTILREVELDIAQKKAEKQELENEEALRKIASEKEQLANDVLVALQRHRELDDRKRSLVDELASLTDEYQSLQQEYTNLAEMHDRTEKEKADFEKRASGAATKAASLEAEMTELRERKASFSALVGETWTALQKAVSEVKLETASVVIQYAPERKAAAEEIGGRIEGVGASVSYPIIADERFHEMWKLIKRAFAQLEVDGLVERLSVLVSYDVVSEYPLATKLQEVLGGSEHATIVFSHVPGESDDTVTLILY